MDQRQRVIVYQNALGHAVNILINNTADDEGVSLTNVLSLAEKITDAALEYAGRGENLIERATKKFSKGLDI